MSQKLALAKALLDIASHAHQQMRINPVEGQQAIAAGLTRIRDIKANTKQRSDLAEFCDTTENFLESMARHDQYHSVFQGALDALGRRAEHVREDTSAVS